jgi:hypothetical protein
LRGRGREKEEWDIEEGGENRRRERLRRRGNKNDKRE